MTTGKPGTLYVVATPIGNLDDWSHRAESILKTVDLIVCEDTRWTRKLLSRYRIRRPTESYHDFNETGRTAALTEKLLLGRQMALVSDAGTPTVSDPGYRLIRACREQGIPVVPIPGPSAVIAALSVSGLPTDQFHFVGFLPSRRAARRRAIEALSHLEATLVLFEAPQRLRATLEDLESILGDRKVCVGREMTKLHESFLFGSIGEVLPRLTEKGEAVIVLEGVIDRAAGEPRGIDLARMTRQELLKIAAKQLGVSRKELWNALYRKEGDLGG